MDTTGGSQLLDWQYRPLDEIQYANNLLRSRVIRINAGMNFRITDWLTAQLQYQHAQQFNDVADIPEPLLARKEIAAVFNISLVTLHDWMKRGLPFHKQRGRVYFLRSEVIAYIKNKSE